MLGQRRRRQGPALIWPSAGGGLLRRAGVRLGWFAWRIE
jgi:hypothetical protein